MIETINTIKKFRNDLLMVYYAEGQELDSDKRKLMENLLSIAERIIK